MSRPCRQTFDSIASFASIGFSALICVVASIVSPSSAHAEAIHGAISGTVHQSIYTESTDLDRFFPAAQDCSWNELGDCPQLLKSIEEQNGRRGTSAFDIYAKLHPGVKKPLHECREKFPVVFSSNTQVSTAVEALTQVLGESASRAAGRCVLGASSGTADSKELTEKKLGIYLSYASARSKAPVAAATAFAGWYQNLYLLGGRMPERLGCERAVPDSQLVGWCQKLEACSAQGDSAEAREAMRQSQVDEALIALPQLQAVEQMKQELWNANRLFAPAMLGSEAAPGMPSILPVDRPKAQATVERMKRLYPGMDPKVAIQMQLDSAEDLHSELKSTYPWLDSGTVFLEELQKQGSEFWDKIRKAPEEKDPALRSVLLSAFKAHRQFQDRALNQEIDRTTFAQACLSYRTPIEFAQRGCNQGGETIEQIARNLEGYPQPLRSKPENEKGTNDCTGKPGCAEELLSAGDCFWKSYASVADKRETARAVVEGVALLALTPAGGEMTAAALLRMGNAVQKASRVASALRRAAAMAKPAAQALGSAVSPLMFASEVGHDTKELSACVQEIQVKARQSATQSFAQEPVCPQKLQAAQIYESAKPRGCLAEAVKSSLTLFFGGVSARQALKSGAAKLEQALDEFVLDPTITMRPQSLEGQSSRLKRLYDETHARRKQLTDPRAISQIKNELEVIQANLKKAKEVERFRELQLRALKQARGLKRPPKASIPVEEKMAIARMIKEDRATEFTLQEYSEVRKALNKLTKKKELTLQEYELLVELSKRQREISMHLEGDIAALVQENGHEVIGYGKRFAADTYEPFPVDRVVAQNRIREKLLSNKVAAEIDIETDFIVEVTLAEDNSLLGLKSKQLQRFIHPKVNPHRKPIIFFAPRVKRAAAIEFMEKNHLMSDGVPVFVTTSKEQLIELIRELDR